SVTAAGDGTFRLLFEHNPLSMWVYDVVTLAFLEVNAAAVEHYGYSRDEFLTMKVVDLFLPEEGSRMREAVARLPQAAPSAIGHRRVRLGPGVRYPLKLMGDVEALRRGETQVIDVDAMPDGPETTALLASGVHVYMVVPMLARGELIGALSFGGARGQFSDEQAEIAREAAAELAIAIAQARRGEEVKRHSSQLEQRVRERTHELAEAKAEADRA